MRSLCLSGLVVLLACSRILAQGGQLTATVASVESASLVTTEDGWCVRLLGIRVTVADSNVIMILDSLIGGDDVVLEYEKAPDAANKSILAYVLSPWTPDAGASLIERGLAVAELQDSCSRERHYMTLEQIARRRGVGVWSGMTTRRCVGTR